MKMSFVRKPTPREKEAMRARAAAKAKREAQRLEAAAKRALAAAEAEAKVKTDAEANAHPPVPVFGVNQPFRALNITWREYETSAIHVESIMTGFEVPNRKGFADIKAAVDDNLEFHATCGDHFSKFFVQNSDDKRIGGGFFNPNITAPDIAYLFAALQARGFAAHVAWTDPDDAVDVEDYTSAAISPIVEEVLAASFESAESPEARDSIADEAFEAFNAAFPMPAYDGEPLCLPIQHGFSANAPCEFLRFEAGEQLPQRFAAMWHAERDRYREILASCPARTFIIYDLRDRREGPMDIYRMTGEFPYTFTKVDEGTDEDGFGYDWSCHGSFFDDAPSAETLAFISCRLAAQGRWMVLVPHTDDFATPEGHARMTGTTLEVVAD
jgi:hypothetical protein